MKYIKKFIKWLQRNKKRTYKIEYFARGFMSNKYSTGNYTFEVCDDDLAVVTLTPAQWGFKLFYGKLKKHYTYHNGKTIFMYNDLIDMESTDHG